MREIVFQENLEGFEIDRIIRDYEYTMPAKHLHEEYEIYYLLEGERYYFIEHQTYLVKKGTLVFVNRGQIHKTGLAGKSYHDRILIELMDAPFSTFFSIYGGLSIADFFQDNNGLLELNEDGQHYVETQLFAIASELQEKKIGYELAAMTRFAHILLYAIRQKADVPAKALTNVPTSAKHKKVDEVALYITENCTSDISLDDLAKHFFVSKCYLSRIFKEVTSFTVNEYINEHRIKLAQKLLMETTLNITEIAEKLGYDSITYFEKVFKKYRGTTPLKYRKLYKEL